MNMSFKKTWGFIVLALLLVFVTILAINFNIRINKLNNELTTTQLKLNKSELLAQDDSIIELDSLLLKGDYENAHKLSLELKNSHVFADEKRIQLRLKMTSDFMEMHKVLQKRTVQEEIAPEEIKKENASQKLETNESLTLALKNAQAEVSKLKKHLKQRTTNSYFTFKTTKGTPLHYVGASSKNQANGYGIAILKSGSRYEGYWKNNLRHGAGKFYWNDGEYYEGEYKNDMRSGTGTYYWSNGDKYIGEWKDDKRNGHGKFYNKKGKIKASGVWKDDKLVDKDHQK